MTQIKPLSNRALDELHIIRLAAEIGEYDTVLSAAGRLRDLSEKLMEETRGLLGKQRSDKRTGEGRRPQ
jgi:hypothetical protein